MIEISLCIGGDRFGKNEDFVENLESDPEGIRHKNDQKAKPA
jgi:hypothetical protein